MNEEIVKDILGSYPALGKRRKTFYRALTSIRPPYHIVETGCVRDGTGWNTPIMSDRQIAGDGISTLLFAQFAFNVGGFLWSVDINPDNVALARNLTKQYSKYCSLVVGNSIEFLDKFPQQMDLLYLDSLDFEPDEIDPSQAHNLQEIQSSEKSLHERSLILIDDYKQPHHGKGGKSVPYLLSKGYQIIDQGYQILLSK